MSGMEIAPEGIRIARMHELVLEVADLEASERFYGEALGLQLVQRWGEDRPAIWFELGDGTGLGLWTQKAAATAIAGGRGGAHVHFAMRVPAGTADSWQQRLESFGYAIERVAFESGNLSIYVDDPDGNCVELMDAATDWAGRPLREREGVWV